MKFSLCLWNFGNGGRLVTYQWEDDISGVSTVAKWLLHNQIWSYHSNNQWDCSILTGDFFNILSKLYPCFVIVLRNVGWLIFIWGMDSRNVGGLILFGMDEWCPAYCLLEVTTKGLSVWIYLVHSLLEKAYINVWLWHFKTQFWGVSGPNFMDANLKSLWQRVKL